MTNGEIREIRKRIDEGLSNIRTVYGCYVDGACRVVSLMEIATSEMDAEERALYSKIIKNAVSGPPGRHLLDVCFDPKQVEKSDEHGMLVNYSPPVEAGACD